MIAYIKEHNLLVENDYMERYLIDILAVDNPDSYITEITVRLKKLSAVFITALNFSLYILSV